MIGFLLIAATCFLAYSNGSNDNFKGVATLFGSGTTGYKGALWWATIATLAGSIASLYFAQGLIKTFSGHGLVPDGIAASPLFLFSVAAGAGMTVMLATVTGFPVSTTHGLTGALFGAGLVAAGTNVSFGFLGGSFIAPLLASPLMAMALSALVYPVFHYLRMRTGLTKEWCLCIGETERVVPMLEPAPVLSLIRIKTVEPRLDKNERCVERYQGAFFGVGCQKLLDVGHYASAGLVSFARGLNDTPKMVALLLAAGGLGVQLGMLPVAVCIAVGGLLSARKVAETMSHKITPMNHGQGFSANLITSLLVIFASRFGLPVSTTHVSTGSLFGIGLATGKTNRRMVMEIVLAWVLTLPIAGFLSASTYWILGNLI